MMGRKERHFAPLIQVSLEELVPVDHFYRHLERILDLSFVRQFVQGTYAGGGRPSIDPVVFFKLQLVEVAPLLWNPETFGLINDLFIRNRTDLAQ